MYFNDNTGNGRNSGRFPGTGGLLGQIAAILDQLGGQIHGPVGRPASLAPVPPFGNVPILGDDGQAAFHPLPGQPGYNPDPGFHRDPGNPSNPDPGFSIGPGDDRYTPNTGVPLLPFGENDPGTAIPLPQHDPDGGPDAGIGRNPSGHGRFPGRPGYDPDYRPGIPGWTTPETGPLMEIKPIWHFGDPAQGLGDVNQPFPPSPAQGYRPRRPSRLPALSLPPEFTKPESIPAGEPVRTSWFIDPDTGKLDYEGFLDAASAKANDNWNPRYGRMVALDDTLDYREALDKARQEQTLALRSMPGAEDLGATEGEGQGDAEQTGGEQPSSTAPVEQQPESPQPSPRPEIPKNPIFGQQLYDPNNPNARDDKPRFSPEQAAQTRKTFDALKEQLNRSWVKEGGNPNNPHDYEYPVLPSPPDTPEGRRIRELIIKYANQYGVPVQLMLNKAFAETRYDQSKVSPDGAIGILQLMPKTANRFHVDPTNLEENIKGATQYMKELLKKAGGDPVKAEAGYFSEKMLYGDPPIMPKTAVHLERVLPAMSNTFIQSRLPTDYTTNPIKWYWYQNPFHRK